MKRIAICLVTGITLATYLSLCLMLAGCRYPSTNQAAARKPAHGEYNAMTFAAFRATAPREPVIFSCEGKLSTLYISDKYRHAEKTMYCVMLRDQNGSVVAFCDKESPTGRKIIAMLSDGYWHKVRVEIQLTGEDSGCVDLVRLVD